MTAPAQLFQHRCWAELSRAHGVIAATSCIKHWEDKIQALDSGLKTVRGDSLVNLQASLPLYADIRSQFDHIAGTLRDMNALKYTQHADTGFAELIRRIRTRLGLS